MYIWIRNFNFQHYICSNLLHNDRTSIDTSAFLSVSKDNDTKAQKSKQTNENKIKKSEKERNKEEEKRIEHEKIKLVSIIS